MLTQQVSVLAVAGGTGTESFVADGVLTTVVLPLSVMVIMVSMGTTLGPSDFRRVFASPREVAVGLGGQIVLLPMIGFVVAAALPLDPVFAVGVVLLAAAPGGMTSNLIVHASNGDRALSVTLTSLSSLLVWITMPLLLVISFDLFDYRNGDEGVDFAFGEVMLSVAALTIVPVGIGMAIRRFKPDLCARIEGPSKTLATALVVVVVVAIVATNWSAVTSNAARFAPAVGLLNAAALGVGYAFARALRVRRRPATTISIEMGLQNAALALTIATSVLNDDELAIVPGLYGVWMLVTGFAFARYMNRDVPGATPTDASAVRVGRRA